MLNIVNLLALYKDFNLKIAEAVGKVDFSWKSVGAKVDFHADTSLC
jgi:hypothetical protein